MKLTEFHIGQLVYDTWFITWGPGEVAHIARTFVGIQYRDRYTSYDLAHLRYLRPVEKAA